jgi:release factor glutamine methyltransferase
VTLKQALVLASRTLAANRDIENSGFESEALLRYLLQISRAQLYLDLNKEIPVEKEPLFHQWIERRLAGEPTAYIINCREFYGLDFYVDQRVLIPRPETELIVEGVINFSRSHSVSVIADIGTGSGAIAVSLAVNIPSAHILATDISGPALEVAHLNCLKHGVSQRVSLIQGDLLEILPGPVDILIANLPYVKQSDLVQIPSARYEPGIALDGGQDGLKQIFRLGRQLKHKVRPGGYVFLEMGMGQGPAIKEYLRQLFPKAPITIMSDLAGIDRIVKVNLPEAD